MGDIHGDLSVRARADTGRMEWTPSPSGTVWRKRVHRVGPPEAGQVTSVVRYQPASSFPTHDHPEGEEILVLDGVFSDEHGHWPKGTYLLNPEGFRHTPFSEPGCLLLVKLRQFPGRDRQHRVIDTEALVWEPGGRPGIAHKPLYRQAGYSDRMRLERWEPDADAGALQHPHGLEIYVIEGELEDEEGRHPAGCWLRLPAGARQHPRSPTGCTLYVKEAGLAYLKASKD